MKTFKDHIGEGVFSNLNPFARQNGNNQPQGQSGTSAVHSDLQILKHLLTNNLIKMPGVKTKLSALANDLETLAAQLN